MDLDPREALAERRDVLVPEAEGRHAHDDELPLEALGRDLAREQRRGGDVPGDIVRREVDPHRPVALGGDPDVADADGAHAAAVAAHAERGHLRRDPEHLHGEPGDERPVDRGDEREPAHDPARHVRAQERVSGRAAVDVGHAAEHRPVASDLARRILAPHRPPA